MSRYIKLKFDTYKKCTENAARETNKGRYKDNQASLEALASYCFALLRCLH